jgi:translation initiation factor IF-3
MATRRKVTLRFRGREITHQDIGMRMLERIRDDLARRGGGGADAQDWKGVR